MIFSGGSTRILAGIPRRAIFDLAEELGYAIEQRAFTVAEAHAAKEAFMSNSSHFVTPVTQIDDAVIANGKPGNLTLELHERYVRYMEAAATLEQLEA